MTQGSILGPLIFLLFVNDLAYKISCDVQQYADDTTLSASGTVQDVSATLTANCGIISDWMSRNSFKLNADKTYVMTLGTSRRLQMINERVSVQMDGETLKEKSEGYECLLGCELQNDLKWNQQIVSVKKKLKNRVAGVFKIHNLLPFATLKLICEGWFNSVLMYCLPLYGGCELQHINDLQTIQNKIARVVTKSRYRTPRVLMYDKLQWMTVRQLLFYHTMLTVFRIRKSGETEFLASLLLKENRNNNIIVPSCNLTLYRKSFVFRGS